LILATEMKRCITFSAVVLVSVICLARRVEAIEIAGELFVSLDASHASAGSASWTNAGTLGSFAEIGDPFLGSVGGLVPAVVFDGVDDAYQSPVNAPAGLVGVDPTRTIEAWVFNPSIPDEETIVSWGRRGGPDGTNMAFNYGRHGTFGAVGHWGAADIGWVDNAGTAGSPEAAKWHHLVYSYDGTTTRVYSDGQLRNSETLAPGAINTHANTKITVASQLEADGVTLTGGLKGSMAVSRLRIHDGVLSDAQILANFNEEVGSFPNPVLPPPPTPMQLTTGPIHRYSFSNPATQTAEGGVLTDSIGGAHGVVRGAGASFNGTELKLPGGSSDTQAYGDLPNGLISGLNEVTIESWVRIEGNRTWQRIFDFGSNEAGPGETGEITGPGNTNGGGVAGLDYIELSANRGDNVSQQRLEWRNEDPAGGGVLTLDADRETIPPQDVHVAVVVDKDGGFFGEPVIRYYRDGMLETEGSLPFNLSDVNDVNNWLGRSNWTGDANLEGSFDEFRIYDRALSQGEVLGNIAAGPDQVNVIPEPGSIIVLVIAMAMLVKRSQTRRSVSGPA
jgi:hypothetical protein